MATTTEKRSTNAYEEHARRQQHYCNNCIIIPMFYETWYASVDPMIRNGRRLHLLNVDNSLYKYRPTTSRYRTCGYDIETVYFQFTLLLSVRSITRSLSIHWRKSGIVITKSTLSLCRRRRRRQSTNTRRRHPSNNRVGLWSYGFSSMTRWTTA